MVSLSTLREFIVKIAVSKRVIDRFRWVGECLGSEMGVKFTRNPSRDENTRT